MKNELKSDGWMRSNVRGMTRNSGKTVKALESIDGQVPTRKQLEKLSKLLEDSVNRVDAMLCSMTNNGQ